MHVTQAAAVAGGFLLVAKYVARSDVPVTDERRKAAPRAYRGLGTNGTEFGAKTGLAGGVVVCASIASARVEREQQLPDHRRRSQPKAQDGVASDATRGERLKWANPTPKTRLGSQRRRSDSAHTSVLHSTRTPHRPWVVPP
jgi:hypothetical protein